MVISSFTFAIGLDEFAQPWLLSSACWSVMFSWLGTSLATLSASA